MRGGISAIGHDTISQTKSAVPPVRSADWTDSSRGELGLQPFAPWLIANGSNADQKHFLMRSTQAALDLCAGASRHDAKERRRSSWPQYSGRWC
jgi:hypothetical protein